MELESFSFLSNKRMISYTIYKKFFDDIISNKKFVCLNDDGDINLTEYFVLVQKMGNCGKFSEVYKLCGLNKQYIGKFKENTKFDIAIKVIPTNEHVLTLENKMNTKYLLWREIKMMKLLTNIVLSTGIPHFSIMYRYYICNKC